MSNLPSGVALMTNLRKVANHPLLVRNKYTDSKLIEMSKEYAKVCFIFHKFVKISNDNLFTVL